MEFSEIFTHALQLPTASYYTPKLAKVRPSECMLVRMNGTAITNAESAVPVIGTGGFNPCCAVILYNNRTKTGLVTHKPWPEGKEFEALLKRVRSDPQDQVDVHIAGGPILTLADEFSSTEEIDSTNEMRVHYLTGFLEAVAAAPNCTLKTFDVYDKPKPHAIAIDARTGNLIRGSKLFKTIEQADEDVYAHPDLFDKWSCMEEMGQDFDGTVQKLKKQTRLS